MIFFSRSGSGHRRSDEHDCKLAHSCFLRDVERVIASIAFRNFKALRSTSLSLAPFNLVIGPNGSGKSSLLEAALRLRTLARLPLGSPGDAEKKAAGPQIEFQFSPPHTSIAAQLSCVSETVCDLLQITPADAAGWPALRADLVQMRGYALDRALLAARALPSDGAKLSADGGNLAAVLCSLREQHPAVFRGLESELKRILPEFAAVEALKAEDGYAELVLRLTDGGRVPAVDLSQGTLYLLAVLALVFDPEPPTLLCIEEIDRGIHPRMLREIRDAFYRLSYPHDYGLERRPTQIIATTHSPYLIDLFREHPEEVVIAQKHGLEAHFERLVDRPDIKELLREGSLGDMWFSGILGGVPEEP